MKAMHHKPEILCTNESPRLLLVTKQQSEQWSPTAKINYKQITNDDFATLTTPSMLRPAQWTMIADFFSSNTNTMHIPQHDTDFWFKCQRSMSMGNALIQKQIYCNSNRDLDDMLNVSQPHNQTQNTTSQLWPFFFSWKGPECHRIKQKKKKHAERT